ncbi:MAG TPA: hypothetical protein VIA10_06330 [Gaiellaceae bacterium]|jgi:hypothetical protein
MDQRKRRIGENEALFRQINDKVEGLNRSLAVLSTRMAVVCECGRQDCLERIDLGIEEYEHVRADSNRFIIKPGHEFPDVEDVVEEHDRYWIVRKHDGGPSRLARATDPRS